MPFAPILRADDRPPEPGVHGYDPRAMKSMRALFLAVGPDIRPGSKLEPFENVNVYPLMAKILGLDAPQVDGSLNVLSKILKNNPADDNTRRSNELSISKQCHPLSKDTAVHERESYSLIDHPSTNPAERVI